MDEEGQRVLGFIPPPFFYRHGRFAEMEPPPPLPSLTIVPPSTYASDILLLAGYEYTCIQEKGCILAIEPSGYVCSCNTFDRKAISITAFFQPASIVEERGN